MVDLFNNVGKVQEEDTYEAAMEKVRRALKGRGIRAVEVYKFLTGMANGGRTFDHWHKKVSRITRRRSRWTGMDKMQRLRWWMP